MAAETPADVHRLWEQAFNAGDADALLALYEEDAVGLADPEGRLVQGRDAIVEALRAFMRAGGTFTLEKPKVHEGPGIALVYTRWRHHGGTGPDGDALDPMTGETTDVVRLGADGGWRFAIDNPWGVAIWS